MTRTPDPLLLELARYVGSPPAFSDEAYATARLVLLDSLACALLALDSPACRRLLGPVVPGATLAGGARVPGTGDELDPVTAAFNLGTMIRWLDFNDTWLAAEWGHPSDNLGGIVAVADYLSRREPLDEVHASAPGARPSTARSSLTVRDVLHASIMATEIQGVLALTNSFNRVGLDHVVLVRVATTAVVTRMLGGSITQVSDALSNAWLDGGALRAYRHAPNAGPRKSWAAGDATRRGVQLALWTLAGEPGYASALSDPQWGFEHVLMRDRPLVCARPLADYVMCHTLFKVSFPAEFHAQTAAEAALVLHPVIRDRLADIKRVRIETQESALRIIHKSGPLTNPAARDHCLEYVTAIALLFGELKAAHYEDAVAADPRIDQLRAKMDVVENPAYSRDYLDPDKRSIANAVQIEWTDGSSSPRVEVEYPLGHRRRRAEAREPLGQKFLDAVRGRFSAARVTQLQTLLDHPESMDMMLVREFVALFLPTG